VEHAIVEDLLAGASLRVGGTETVLPEPVIGIDRAAPAEAPAIARNRLARIAPLALRHVSAPAAIEVLFGHQLERLDGGWPRLNDDQGGQRDNQQAQRHQAAQSACWSQRASVAADDGSDRGSGVAHRLRVQR
jgi:hypothetical protein